MQIHSKKRRRQKGNAAIETVLVIVPLFIVLLGIIDFSVAIFVMDTLEYASRMGVRYAITGANSTASQDTDIKNVVLGNSLGFLDSSKISNVTVTYYALDTKAGSKTQNEWVVATGVNSNAGGNLVKVGVTGFSWAWMVPGWRGADTLTINTASADIVEGSGCVPSCAAR